MKLSYFTLYFESRQLPSDLSVEYSRILRNESAYLTEYLLRKMNPVFKFDCARINFVCKDGDVREGIRDFGSVHEMDVYFDLAYFDLSPEEKQQHLFELLIRELRRLCDYKGWEFEPFAQQLTALQEGGFYVEYTMLKKKQSPDKKHTSAVICVQTMHETRFFVEFADRKKQVWRTPLLTLTANEAMDCRIAVNSMEWLDSDSVAIYDWRKAQARIVAMDR